MARLTENQQSSAAPDAQLPKETDFNAKLATVRGLTQAGVIRGTQVERGSGSPIEKPAPVEPTISAGERRRIERQKNEHEAV